MGNAQPANNMVAGSGTVYSGDLFTANNIQAGNAGNGHPARRCDRRLSRCKRRAGRGTVD